MTEELSDPQPTPRYQAILAAASRRAVDLRHDYIGTEHLLLALLADTDAVATQVLGRFAPATEITDELQTVMVSKSYNTPGKPRAEPGLTS
jgi:ATP-dependent Clp protease ATP-binding subunit ClpA